jgi:hypothetical protein
MGKEIKKFEKWNHGELRVISKPTYLFYQYINGKVN